MTGDKDILPEKKVLECMFRETAEAICRRAKEVLRCELEISGVPYCTTSTIEQVHRAWFPWKKKRTIVIVRIKGGLLRGANKPWTIHCDVFRKDIERIAALELGALAERLVHVDVSITACYEQEA